MLADITCKASGSNSKQQSWEIPFEEEEKQQKDYTNKTKKEVAQVQTKQIDRHAVEILLSEPAGKF